MLRGFWCPHRDGAKPKTTAHVRNVTTAFFVRFINFFRTRCNAFTTTSTSITASTTSLTSACKLRTSSLKYSVYLLLMTSTHMNSVSSRNPLVSVSESVDQCIGPAVCTIHDIQTCNKGCY